MSLKWAASAEHVRIMPVVSADGKCWCSLLVILGKRQEYRFMSNGTIEKTATYLPVNVYVTYCNPAGVDTKIFLEWMHCFVKETKDLREKYE